MERKLNLSLISGVLVFAKNVPAKVASSIPWPAVAAGIAAITIALINFLYSQWASRVDRRRHLYSEAYKAAMAWVEMLYRVRRRGEGTGNDLVERFHVLQETIAYHEGWLATESPALARSYCKLIDAVRDAVSPLIKQAWTDEPRARSHQRIDGDEDPNVRSARDDFLRDARDHLSLWPWVRLGVIKRNPREKKS